MPREVRVLAIEDKPWRTQPLFSFPLVGELSVRELSIVALFIVSMYSVANLLGLGFPESMIFVIIGLSVGLGVARRRVKSVLPEKQLLVLLTGRFRPKRTGAIASTRKRGIVREAAYTPETVDIIARDSSRIPTIKIIGVLRDPLGSPLANRELEVYINNKKYARVRTGANGEYIVYYTPDGPGLYDVEIKLHGMTVLKKRVRVGVRG